MLPERDEQLLAAAIRGGLITHEAAIAARRKAEALAAGGRGEPVWRILVGSGELSREQALSLGAAEAAPAAAGGEPSTKRLGRYRIVERIGSGGMGAVYKATDERTGRTVAIKVLPPKLAADRGLVERFLAEARNTVKLSHPNIVQGLDAGLVDGFYYFAMEHMDMGSAGTLLAERGSLGEGQVLATAEAVASALQCAFENGLVHGDVKPENIMMNSRGEIKLADLGVARSVEAASDGPPLGTPYYISPEQARSGKAVDIRSDIYSLGTTLYHLLAGRPPYLGPTPRVVLAKHLQHKIPDVRERVPGVTKGLSQIIRRMMAKDPRGRYETPEEILKDIERLREGKPLVSGTGSHRRVSSRSEAPADDASGEEYDE